MNYFLTLFLLLFTACAGINQNVKDANLNPEKRLINSHYANLDLKQDVFLLSNLNSDLKENPNAYKKQFFKAWHSSFKNLESENLFWSFKLYLNPENFYYFYNKQAINKTWFEKQIANANTEKLGTINQKALVIKNSLLKNFPTKTAILKDPFKQGEGIPFDYANDSILNIGSAVLISHFSKDKQWAFVMSESGVGFVESENLEPFTKQRTEIYENLNFITPLEEKMPVFTQDGKFFFETRIGSIYPYYKSDEKFYYGKIGKKKYKISKSKAAKFPLEFNDKNLKHQLAQVLNLPYGWGGYDFQRDCSLLMREIFSSFAIYMPRNSKAQNEAFVHFDVSFMTNLQKQEFLKLFGKPYLTLLYLKGHIMLYAGSFENQNVAIHSIWGLRKNEDDRLLIAQSAITRLDIGKGLISDENLLLSKILEISFIKLDAQEITKIKAYIENLKSKS